MSFAIKVNGGSGAGCKRPLKGHPSAPARLFTPTPWNCRCGTENTEAKCASCLAPRFAGEVKA